MTEAGLFIHPITYDDYGIPHSEEDQHFEEDRQSLDLLRVEPAVETTDVNNNLEAERDIAPSIETQTSNPELNASIEELDDDEIIRRALEEDVGSDEFDADLQRRIEEMIDSVISAAKEDVDWQSESRDNIEISSEDIQISSDNIQASSLNMEASSENIEASLENIEASSENIEASSENIEASDEKLDCSEDFKGSLESVEAPMIKTLNYLPVKSSVKIEFTEAENVPVTETVCTPEEFNLPEAPMPPPRRKSTSQVEGTTKQETSTVVETFPSIVESQVEQQETPRTSEIERQDTCEEETFSSQLPSRLHLSSLEIDNLSVCSLQAGRITASEIDSNTIVTNEFDCRINSRLPNTRSIEFPPGFIDEIVERVRCASRAEIEHQTQQTETLTESRPKDEPDQPPVRPPLPSQFHSEYSSVPPPSFYQLRDFSEDEALQKSPQRRRKHQAKRRNSTSEEDCQREHRRSGRGGLSSDQSVLGLGGQFARACGNALKEGGSQMMEILRASSKDENKRDLHIALIILIVICAGLILMGMGDKSVHHHHWDFFNPPDNHGRP